MSAAVCGSKRSFFEELPPSPPFSKRHRRSSPVRFSSADHLRSLFPHMDPQILERALEECGNDIDVAIKRLNELHIEGAAVAAGPIDAVQTGIDVCLGTDEEVAATSGNTSGPNNLPADGAEWVELFVREMQSATSMDDARGRAGNLLQVFEKSITSRVALDAAQNFHKENMSLKEQIEGLIRDNSVLKRAVSIQHERQKENEGRDQEFQHLKLLVTQYQEQLRTLQLNNYALTLQLKQAQQHNSFPGRYNPDVF